MSFPKRHPILLIIILKPRANALVCLSDLQISQEMVPVFYTQDALTSIYFQEKKKL